MKAADPDDKAEVYRQLGLRPTYHPSDKAVIAETAPTTLCRVVVSEGGIDRYAQALHQRNRLPLG